MAKSTFYQRMVAGVDGNITLARAAARRGEHLPAALRFAKAAGIAKAIFEYQDVHGHPNAREWRTSYHRFEEQADLAIRFATVKPHGLMQVGSGEYIHVVRESV